MTAHSSIRRPIASAAHLVTGRPQAGASRRSNPGDPVRKPRTAGLTAMAGAAWAFLVDFLTLYEEALVQSRLQIQQGRQATRIAQNCCVITTPTTGEGVPPSDRKRVGQAEPARS